MFLALAVLLTAVYENSLHVPFYFDDFPNIVKNARLHLQDLSPPSLSQALHAHPLAPGKLYRPVTNLTFGITYAFFGQEVAGYHVGNLIVHILAAFFLYLLFQEVLRLPRLRERYGGKAFFVAAFGCSLWALHPIQTQSVTYIVQRMTSLSGLFYILAMLLFLRGRIVQGKAAKCVLFSGCLLSACLSAGAKENGVMVPASLLLLEWLLIGDSIVAHGWTKRAVALAGLGLLVLGVVVLAHGGTGLLAGYSVRPFTLGERFLTEPRVVLFYLSLILYPAADRFSLLHDVTLSKGLWDPPETVFALLLLGALVALAFLSRRKAPIMAFAVFFFLVNHLVESSVLPLELVYEHRNYLPSAFLFLSFASGASILLSRLQGSPPLRGMAAGATVLSLIVLGVATHTRNAVWLDQEIFWLDVIKKAPTDARAHMNLSRISFEEGRYKEAILANLVAAASCHFPRNDMAHLPHLNLAACFMQQGLYAEGIRECERVNVLKPGVARSYYYLATAYRELGNPDAAYAHAVESVALAHKDADAQLLLARLALEKGDAECARGAAREAYLLAPERTEPLLLLGLAYLEKGNRGLGRWFFGVVHSREAGIGTPFGREAEEALLRVGE